MSSVYTCITYFEGVGPCNLFGTVNVCLQYHPSEFTKDYSKTMGKNETTLVTTKVQHLYYQVIKPSLVSVDL